MNSLAICNMRTTEVCIQRTCCFPMNCPKLFCVTKIGREKSAFATDSKIIRYLSGTGGRRGTSSCKSERETMQSSMKWLRNGELKGEKTFWNEMTVKVGYKQHGGSTS